MDKFSYRRGTWEDGHSLPGSGENEEYDAYLERIGYYSKAARFGHDDASQFTLFQHSTDGSFFAEVSFMNGHCFEVYLPDFPSAMQFIKEHASAFSADEATITQREIHSLLEKSFQAQHGRPSHDICAKCDPVGWEKVLQYRQQRL